LVKQELALLKTLPDAPLHGRLLALPTNNRLDWKGFPGQTFELITKIYKLRAKKFYNIAPWPDPTLVKHLIRIYPRGGGDKLWTALLKN
jgi:hypothetical protein